MHKKFAKVCQASDCPPPHPLNYEDHHAYIAAAGFIGASLASSFDVPKVRVE